MSQIEPNDASKKYEEQIPAELIEEYLRIRSEDIVASKYFYFQQLMPRFRPLLESRPEHVAIREAQHREGFSTLVSLMGFSPETTVHAAVILRPKKLVVAYSENGRETARPAFEYLQRENIVDVLDTQPVPIDAFNPQDIYDKLRQYLRDNEKSLAEADNVQPANAVIVDITGGTKLMSASSGALAWESNLRLCYLNGGWNPQQGASGLAQTSQMMIFRNPSRKNGYQRRYEALDHYRRGDFVAGIEGFEESQRLIDDSFFDLLAYELCCTYRLVTQFDFEATGEAISRLEGVLSIAGVRRLYENRLNVQPHVEHLRRFAERDPQTIIAALFELAEIYVRRKRYDFAGLLFYRAMEALVEVGLKNLAPDFEMNKPDFSLLSINEEVLRKEYARLSPDGSGTAVLPRGELRLLSGFGVLCVLDDQIPLRFMNAGETELRNAEKSGRLAVGNLMRLAEIRNQSYLAHAFRTLSQEECENIRTGADQLASAILHEQYAAFMHLRSNLRPLDLSAIAENL